MSNALVLPFFRRSSRSSDWSQQEIAEFYRVESALVQSGLSVTTDRGISDEGDPWFVFCRADNDEVIAHFARIDYDYVVASSFQPSPVRGRNFRALIREMMELHPLMVPVRRSAGQKVFLHPSALLLALLASAYFHSSEVVSDHAPTASDSRSSSLLSLLGEKIAIVAAIALAATWLEHQASSALKFIDGFSVFHDSSDVSVAHAAATPHEAQLDYLSQFFHSLGFDARHSVLSQQAASLLAPQDGDGGQNHSPLLPNTGPALPQSSGPVVDAAAAGALSDSLTKSSADGDGVAAAPSVGGQTLIGSSVALALAEHQPEVSAATNHLADDQSLGAVNSIVAPNNDALQVAVLESGNSSIQPIVLSSNPETVDVALQQALQQAGFGSSVLHDTETTAAASGVSPASAGTPETAVVSQPVSQATTSSASGPPVESVTQVEQIVANFLAHTPNFETTISGANVVIVDTNPSDMKSGQISVETFNMADGSTLSIVGIIQHPHLLSA
jgi:hypothetical protein